MTPPVNISFAAPSSRDFSRGVRINEAGRVIARDASGSGSYVRHWDSFNPGTGWVAPDCVAIDQGPLVLAIENARTGNVWKWFHAHRWVRAGAERLGMVVNR